MKTLIYISAGILIIIIIHSCHPNHLQLTEDSYENLQNRTISSARSDSADYKSADPPKDRDHWKSKKSDNYRK
ncbi:hypothetical protein [Chryseobacterium sp.]|uniref:hypothetical protein n=1 Tax=Chryseobacterium sp. TaxID=1871047 RepID=UPI0025BD6D55|nr:hypothetical protein [Chryseobacterium sp.]MBV8326700.1 hypothetical protein [Chryseobacterium sp.]